MLYSMTLGVELKKALHDAGLTPSAFARAIGHKNSGNVTYVLKDRRPFPESKLPKAIEVLGLNAPGREKQREAFLREAMVAYLPEAVRPQLRKRFRQIDDLEARAHRFVETERASRER